MARKKASKIAKNYKKLRKTPTTLGLIKLKALTDKLLRLFNSLKTDFKTNLEMEQVYNYLVVFFCWNLTFI